MLGFTFAHPNLLHCQNLVSCNNRRAAIKPTKPVIFISGLRAALNSIGATQSDQYSWIGKTEESYAFTAEIDHIDKEKCKYNHRDGVFFKRVKPLSVADGFSHQTVRHSQELFYAIKHAHESSLKCKLLLVKGTKYGTSTGGVKAAVDGDSWVVKEISGDVAGGYEFILERTA